MVISIQQKANLKVKKSILVLTAKVSKHEQEIVETRSLIDQELRDYEWLQHQTSNVTCSNEASKQPETRGEHSHLCLECAEKLSKETLL